MHVHVSSKPQLICVHILEPSTMDNSILAILLKLLLSTPFPEGSFTTFTQCACLSFLIIHPYHYYYVSLNNMSVLDHILDEYGEDFIHGIWINC